MTDGKVIRVPVPPMTEERRKDVVKQLNKTLEDHKTAIRNIRRDGNEQIKKAAKDKLISADDEKRANDEVQQLTDTEIKRIEDLFKAKEKRDPNNLSFADGWRSKHFGKGSGFGLGL